MARSRYTLRIDGFSTCGTILAVKDHVRSCGLSPHARLAAPSPCEWVRILWLGSKWILFDTPGWVSGRSERKAGMTHLLRSIFLAGLALTCFNCNLVWSADAKPRTFVV